MKLRTFYVFFVLLFVTFFCQAEKYKLTFSVTAVTYRCETNKPNEHILSYTLRNENNSSSYVLAYSKCGNKIKYRNKVAYISFLPANFFINEIKFGVPNNREKEVFIPFCNDMFIGDGVIIKVEPVANIIIPKGGNTTSCNIELELDEKNFPSEVYLWQYYDSELNIWENFPEELQGTYKTVFNLDIVFGLNKYKYINKAFSFRVFLPCSNTNIVTYTTIGCSPSFNGYYDKTNITCSYKSDGKVSLKLDRDLEKEKLVVTLFKKYKNIDITEGQESTTKPLEYISVGNYGFVWPHKLGKGTYFFKYQTLNTNTNPPDPLPPLTDSYWDKYITTELFDILPAENVAFTVAKQNDETCFNSGDGQIKLNILKEKTNEYEYIIYEVNGTTETLYRDWIAFTGPEITIKDLEKQTYIIKVKNSKGCFASE